MLTEKHSGIHFHCDTFCGSDEHLLSLRLLTALPPVFINLAYTRSVALPPQHALLMLHPQLASVGVP